MFLVVLTVLVFVHELGHYLIARRNGVRIEVFSIGFGPELFGWWDRAGTRWKFSTIPLGGYVKMFGDSDASSGLPVAGLGAADRGGARGLVPLQAARPARRDRRRRPVANFLFAIVVLALLFMTYGQPFTPAEVGQVLPGSAAERGGIRPGDTIVSIDGSAIDRFEDVQQVVRFNPNVPMTMIVRRDGELRHAAGHPEPGRGEATGSATPSDRPARHPRQRRQIHPARPGDARSGARSARPGTCPPATLQAMWQMIIGTRGTDELGGPLRIAQLSGEVAQGGVVPLLWFMAVLSVNLGLINLFPVPVLDGGHLLFYAAEAIRGKPLGQRAQEYGFRVGLALVLTLMVFATWNDLVHTGIVDIVKRFVT